MTAGVDAKLRIGEIKDFQKSKVQSSVNISLTWKVVFFCVCVCVKKDAQIKA